MVLFHDTLENKIPRIFEVENMAPFLIQLIKVYTVRNNSEENKER